ncbi:hypothetical protein M5K25_010235 [Dendrobium thyrsiflorum]|uniref:Uncharacterized protein n=1 Tax=Dendrobium thyrsiflorum TaxID=117978 RepID=A0ABD0V671_DENTH
MAAKKVEALEERLDGEVGNMKSEFGERISAIKGRFSNLEEMMKKMIATLVKMPPEVAESTALEVKE